MKTPLNAVIPEKLTQWAMQLEEDIKEGRVMSRAEVVRLADKLIKPN